MYRINNELTISLTLASNHCNSLIDNAKLNHGAISLQF